MLRREMPLQWMDENHACAKEKPELQWDPFLVNIKQKLFSKETLSAVMNMFFLVQLCLLDSLLNPNEHICTVNVQVSERSLDCLRQTRSQIAFYTRKERCFCWVEGQSHSYPVMEFVRVTWSCAFSKFLPESDKMSAKEAIGPKWSPEREAVSGHSSSITNPGIMAFNR